MVFGKEINCPGRLPSAYRHKNTYRYLNTQNIGHMIDNILCADVSSIGADCDACFEEQVHSVHLIECLKALNDYGPWEKPLAEQTTFL